MERSNTLVLNVGNVAWDIKCFRFWGLTDLFDKFIGFLPIGRGALIHEHGQKDILMVDAKKQHSII